MVRFSELARPSDRSITEALARADGRLVVFDPGVYTFGRPA